MPKLKRALFLAFISVTLVLSSAPRALTQGSVYGSTTITIPGAVAADARGINDSGQIAGRYIDGSVIVNSHQASGANPAPAAAVPSVPVNVVRPPRGEEWVHTVNRRKAKTLIPDQVETPR